MFARRLGSGCIAEHWPRRRSYQGVIEKRNSRNFPIGRRIARPKARSGCSGSQRSATRTVYPVRVSLRTLAQAAFSASETDVLWKLPKERSVVIRRDPVCLGLGEGDELP